MSLLDSISGFEPIAPLCERACVPSPWPPGVVAVFLIEGGSTCLVDTGSGTAESDAALEAALRARLGATPPGGAILTHAHLDHIGGLERLSPSHVIAHRDAVTSMRAEHRLPTFVAVREMTGEHGVIPGLEGWEWVLGEGHAPGHLLPWHPRTGTLIAGDQFLQGLKTPLRVADPETDSYGEYLASLRRVSALEPRIMLTSHTEPIHDPVRWLGRAERRMRKKLTRTVAAIRGTPRTAEQVMAQLYRSIPGPGARQLLVREQTAALRHLHLVGEADRIVEGGVERFVAA